MPSVLILATGEDTGGVGVAISRAFAKHAPDWNLRFVRRCDNYIKYPVDIEWVPGDDRTEVVVRRLWEQADVLHFFQKWIRLDDSWETKPKVLHHHGRAFRGNPDGLIQEAEDLGVTAICSTVDLVSFAPTKLTWLPNPHDLDSLAATRDRFYKPTGRVRIAHAPTIRSGKSTDAFLDACARLRREFAVEVDVIERMSWDDCLRRKAMADIYYDQVLTAYGNNATEAWAMGIPVVAGVDPARAAMRHMNVPARTRDQMLSLWGEIPFLEATEDTIYDALKLLMDPDQRVLYGQKGLEHVRKWHDEAVVVKQLIGLYESAML